MSTCTVLIIEDDPIVALDLSLIITEMECTVVGIASKRSDAIQIMECSPANIIMCDIHLQCNHDGIDIIEEIRSKFDPSIIYLSALEDTATIHRAVQTSPCGYLLKPYRYSELFGLIHIAKHRTAHTKKQILDLGGGYLFSTTNNLLYQEDIPVDLTNNELKLITLLISRRQKMVPFHELEYHIWSENTISESTRRTLIYRLHTKLHYPIITVVQGRGCYLSVFPPKFN